MCSREGVVAFGGSGQMQRKLHYVSDDDDFRKLVKKLYGKKVFFSGTYTKQCVVRVSFQFLNK